MTGNLSKWLGLVAQSGDGEVQDPDYDEVLDLWWLFHSLALSTGSTGSGDPKKTTGVGTPQRATTLMVFQKEDKVGGWKVLDKIFGTSWDSSKQKNMSWSCWQIFWTSTKQWQLGNSTRAKGGCRVRSFYFLNGWKWEPAPRLWDWLYSYQPLNSCNSTAMCSYIILKVVPLSFISSYRTSSIMSYHHLFVHFTNTSQRVKAAGGFFTENLPFPAWNSTHVMGLHITTRIQSFQDHLDQQNSCHTNEGPQNTMKYGVGVFFFQW